jgi:hypothetical protein
MYPCDCVVSALRWLPCDSRHTSFFPRVLYFRSHLWMGGMTEIVTALAVFAVAPTSCAGALAPIRQARDVYPTHEANLDAFGRGDRVGMGARWHL